VEVTALIEALRREGELMALAAAQTDPDTAVPTCPEWTVRDLVRHMGGVHRWATGYVADRRTEVRASGLDEVVGTWPADAALVGWLREGCTALADALASAPDDLECWTFLPAPSPRAMWARRQAHETAIHRVDAQLAAHTALSPFEADFAADGIDELLTCFVPRRSIKRHADVASTLVVDCTDHEAAWVLRLGPEDEHVSTAPAPPGGGGGGDGDCAVRGAAADLYPALWNRTSPEGTVVAGDEPVLDLFLGTVRWS
jgi:uncharacterized protein (TIGR03083 family)